MGDLPTGEPGASPTPGGPEEASRRWIEAVMEEGDWEEAWSLMDELLRLAHAQAWLWNNRDEAGIAGEDLDELARGLSQGGPWHPLWDDFAEVALEVHHQAWQEFDLERWSVAGTPHLVAPDVEVVVYVRAEDEPIIVTDPLLVVARPFLMRFSPDSGWLVAHAGSDQLPVPGWPPEFPSATSEH